jgi:hypothetical protein
MKGLDLADGYYGVELRESYHSMIACKIYRDRR